MMRIGLILAVTSTLVLAACSEADVQSVYEREGSVEPVTTANIAEASPEEADGSLADSRPDALEVSAPQIAYRYALGFRLPANAIKPLQEKHADMCEARGPKICRIISMDQADSDGDYAYGNLQLAVAADDARAFSKELEAGSDSADGELTSSSITGEDLSKQIVDTEAKLRARTLLRDRLMDILRTSDGTVAELVEAERGVAQVNQEIDQARSWLSEMRGRVAFSQMQIRYESGSPSAGGFGDPIRSAWGSLGSIFGGMIALLILASAVLIPLGGVAWLTFKLWRWLRPKTIDGVTHANQPVTNDAVELPNES
ncbi:MAG: DUF4349 domain-containing protein [Pseudomonadota bacterium]